MKRTRIRPVSSRQAKRDRILAKRRKEMIDGRLCVRCAKATAVTLHHRRRQGRTGGHCRENLAALCDPCHRTVHAEIDQAREDGWIVSEGHPDFERLGLDE